MSRPAFGFRVPGSGFRFIYIYKYIYIYIYTCIGVTEMLRRATASPERRTKQAAVASQKGEASRSGVGEPDLKRN